MAEYKAVNAEQLDADLTAVADAIRETGITADKLALPEGYKEAIAKMHEQMKLMVGWRYEDGERRIIFPKGIVRIRPFAFYDFQNSYFDNVIPEGVRVVSSDAFHNCFKITNVIFPKTLTALSSQAYANCLNLKSVTFQSVPTALDTSAFASCAALATINVPWAEREIAGAPWGATNATINYNYVAEG